MLRIPWTKHEINEEVLTLGHKTEWRGEKERKWGEEGAKNRKHSEEGAKGRKYGGKGEKAENAAEKKQDGRKRWGKKHKTGNRNYEHIGIYN